MCKISWVFADRSQPHIYLELLTQEWKNIPRWKIPLHWPFFFSGRNSPPWRSGSCGTIEAIKRDLLFHSQQIAKPSAESRPMSDSKRANRTPGRESSEKRRPRILLAALTRLCPPQVPDLKLCIFAARWLHAVDQGKTGKMSWRLEWAAIFCHKLYSRHQLLVVVWTKPSIDESTNPQRGFLQSFMFVSLKMWSTNCFEASKSIALILAEKRKGHLRWVVVFQATAVAARKFSVFRCEERLLIGRRKWLKNV